MSENQKTLTLEQVQEAVRTGAPLKDDDRVWVESMNMSIRSYIRRFEPDLWRRRRAEKSKG
jgi:hypothetical protein